MHKIFATQLLYLPFFRRCQVRLLCQAITLLVIFAVTISSHSSSTILDDEIPALKSESIQPVSVIDRDDIEMSGMNNVGDLVFGRLKHNSFGLYRSLILGSGRVAFLINGRRISGTRFGTDLNYELNALPISAVERIEIISDSATVLGGHAIGGAINIVLRRDLDGSEFGVTALLPADTGGDSGHGSALWGGTLGSGHITMGADILRSQEIRDTERDYSRARWTPGDSFADAAGVSSGGNTVIISTADGSIVRPLGDCQGSAYVSGLINPSGISGSGCGFAWADIAWAWKSLERESLFLNLDHPLGKKAEMYFDARFAQGGTAFRYAPSVGTFIFTPTQEIRDLLEQDPEIDTLPPNLFVAHRFIGHGNRDWQTDLEEYSLTLGAKGKLFNEVGYDAYLRYYHHGAVESGETFVSESAIQRTIDAGRYDLTNPLSTATEHLSAIRETGLRLTREQATTYKTAGAAFDGTLFALGGGDMRWVAGAEIADEDWQDLYDFRDIDNRLYEADDVLGSAGNSAAGERSMRSVFTAINLPVHSAWDVNLSARHDDYNDVGTASSHQIASRYQLTKNFMLRGSWNVGSKAPSLRALHAKESLGYPYICDKKTFVGNLEDCDVFQVEQVVDSNPNLKPDDAESISFGLMANFSSFSFSADWFDINLSNLPGRLSAQAIIDLEAKNALPAGAAVLRDGDQITQIVNPLFNNGQSDVSGADLRLQKEWKTDRTEMVLDVRWTRTTRYVSRVAGEVQPGDFPRDHVSVSFRASHGDVTAQWSIYKVSGFWNVNKTGRYNAWLGHDITLRRHDVFGFNGMDLTGGILNIEDHSPSTDPTVPGVEGADETMDAVRGRTIFLAVKMSF